LALATAAGTKDLATVEREGGYTIMRFWASEWNVLAVNAEHVNLPSERARNEKRRCRERRFPSEDQRLSRTGRPEMESGDYAE